VRASAQTAAAVVGHVQREIDQDVDPVGANHRFRLRIAESPRSIADDPHAQTASLSTASTVGMLPYAKISNRDRSWFDSSGIRKFAWQWSRKSGET